MSTVVKSLRYWSAIPLLLSSLSLTTMGAEYVVEFARSGSGIKTVILDSSEITTSTPWHTINDPNGVNVYNASGNDLAAVWIKVKNPNDTFRVSIKAKNQLFARILARKNGKEVIFLDARGWTANSTIWNRVNNLKAIGTTTKYIFDGQLYTTNPPLPDLKDWDDIKTTEKPLTTEQEPWSDITSKLPEGFNEVTCYISNANGDQLFLISNNVVFSYKINDSVLTPVLIRGLYPNGINRLELANDDKLEVWKDGDMVGSVNISESNSYGPPIDSR
jgi:hypothetical protein